MILAKTMQGWYGLLHAVGMDFSGSIGLSSNQKGVTGLIMSGLYMSHLTILYCYMATPVVWALNPQQFVFHEMVMGCAFLAAMTGVVLTANPVEISTTHSFRRNSSFLSALRFLVALVIAVALIGLLFVLVQLSTEAVINFGK